MSISQLLHCISHEAPEPAADVWVWEYQGVIVTQRPAPVIISHQSHLTRRSDSSKNIKYF